MTPIVLALPGNDALAAGLAAGLDAELGRVVVRPFPDGESYVRIESEVAARPVILACTLDRPDAKLTPSSCSRRPHAISALRASVSSRPIWDICARIDAFFPGKA